MNILNKQSRTADEGWSSSLGVRRGANNASPSKTFVKKYSQVEMLPLETKQSGGKLHSHSDLRRGVFLEEVSRSLFKAGSCEYGDELSGSIKCGEFLD